MNRPAPTPLTALALLLVPVPLASGLVEVGEPIALVVMGCTYLIRVLRSYCPSFSVASNMSREVFNTSTLFW